MNKYLCCFFVFFSCAFFSCKKDLLQWKHVQQLNSHTTSRLNKIHFVNDSVCIICGGEKFLSAVVLRSTDQGNTWTIDLPSQADKAMYGFGTSPNGTMYMCGITGRVLVSHDTGISWQTRIIEPELYYVDVTFPTADMGLLISQITYVSGSILQVDTNFQVQQTTSYNFALNNIDMVTSQMGYIVAYGTMLKTTDGGHTWGYLPISGDNFDGIDVHNNGNEAWVCGYEGSIFYTNNGGANWTKLRNGNDITLVKYRLLAIAFKDDLNGWAVGEDGVVIYTNDGGQNWMEYQRFTDNALRSIAFRPDGSLLVAGDNGALYSLQ